MNQIKLGMPIIMPIINPILKRKSQLSIAIPMPNTDKVRLAMMLKENFSNLSMVSIF